MLIILVQLLEKQACLAYDKTSLEACFSQQTLVVGGYPIKKGFFFACICHLHYGEQVSSCHYSASPLLHAHNYSRDAIRVKCNYFFTVLQLTIVIAQALQV
jgi:hypothetical protein